MRIQTIGGGALILGLALIGFSGRPASVVTSDHMTSIYGGDCYYCSQGQRCIDVACEKIKEPGDPNDGKYRKSTGQQDSEGNWLAEAVCATRRTTGKRECEEDHEVLCMTQVVCDNAACTMNCSSQTISVNNNCWTAGVCSGS